jgi:hypothetical protein
MSCFSRDHSKYESPEENENDNEGGQAGEFEKMGMGLRDCIKSGEVAACDSAYRTAIRGAGATTQTPPAPSAFARLGLSYFENPSTELGGACEGAPLVVRAAEKAG